MREEEHARILACSNTLWPERVCYQEGCVARGWGFRVEGEGMGLAGPGESWATLGKWKGAR